MIWIFLTILISTLNLLLSVVLNPKLKDGFKILGSDTEMVVLVITLSIIPGVNIFTFIRIIILTIGSYIYSYLNKNNYGKKHY